jgi:hypothetical protein
MSPVYWKPKYGTRSSRHRAWARQEARREAKVSRKPGGGLPGWLRRLFRQERA